jgi:hypothetical protein
VLASSGLSRLTLLAGRALGAGSSLWAGVSVVSNWAGGTARVGTVDTGMSLLALRAGSARRSLRASWAIDLHNSTRSSFGTSWARRANGALKSERALESAFSLVAVLAVLSGLTLGAARSLVAGLPLVAGRALGADDTWLVGDGRAEHISVLSITSVLAVVAIFSSLTIVSGGTRWARWSLLAVAARGSRLGVDDAVAVRLALVPHTQLLLVEDAHLRPHVPSSALAEFRLGDQVALEPGHVGIEHRECDDAANDGGCGDHNGEEGHAPQLAVLIGLPIMVVEYSWLLFLLIHLSDWRTRADTNVS